MKENKTLEESLKELNKAWGEFSDNFFDIIIKNWWFFVLWTLGLILILIFIK